MNRPPSRRRSRCSEPSGASCSRSVRPDAGTLKALNNYLAATSFAATSEAVLIGERFGLDPSIMADIVNVSTGKTFGSEYLLQQQILSGRFGSGFAAGLLARDVKIAFDLGEELGND